MVVGALAVAAPASADDAAQKDGQARFEEGIARVRAHDFEAALLSFRQAYAVTHSFAVVWNLALVEEKTNHPVEALGHFKEYLRVAPPTDPDRSRARKHIDGLNAAMGHIDVSAPTGAVITVDGTQSLGATPLGDPVDVLPGRHSVEARLGAVVRSLTVDALAGPTIRADFGGMVGPDAPASAPPGIAATRQADSLSSGAEPHPPDAAQGHSPSTARVITVASLAGAALISLGTGFYFALASHNDANIVAGFRSQYPSDECANNSSTAVCAQWRGAVNGQNTDAALSDVFYIGSGVLAAASVATFVWWPRESKGVSMWLVPTASPAGLGAAGRF